MLACTYSRVYHIAPWSADSCSNLRIRSSSTEQHVANNNPTLYMQPYKKKKESIEIQAWFLLHWRTCWNNDSPLVGGHVRGRGTLLIHVASVTHLRCVWAAHQLIAFPHAAVHRGFSGIREWHAQRRILHKVTFVGYSSAHWMCPLNHDHRAINTYCIFFPIWTVILFVYKPFY